MMSMGYFMDKCLSEELDMQGYPCNKGFAAALIQL